MYEWFKVCNLDEFIATGLISKVYSYNTPTGDMDFMMTQGKTFGVFFDEVFLSLGLNGENPFKFDNKAAYIDEDNNVYVGNLIEVDE